ncbi:MAG: hypothetical protein GF365_01395|nr:hypothetical protein [Candidatus Buchananbacteria bacterium]
MGWKSCSSCGGSGKKQVISRGDSNSCTTTTCSACGGSGRIKTILGCTGDKKKYSRR